MADPAFKHAVPGHAEPLIHAQGCIALYYKSDKALLTGDHLFFRDGRLEYSRPALAPAPCLISLPL